MIGPRPNPRALKRHGAFYVAPRSPVSPTLRAQAVKKANKVACELKKREAKARTALLSARAKDYIAGPGKNLPS
jgi:hypothetical protein